MSAAPQDATRARETFNRLLGELRPKLHRYCARMTGSVIDGEDVVQEALVKAVEAFEQTEAIPNLQGWLFRIAHNTALDVLRRRARQTAISADEDLDMIFDPVIVTEDRQTASASLRTLMRLPVAQRSSVILMDVLGYSLDEISLIIETSVPAVKAALHRGRARPRELAQEPEDRPLPILREPERSRLAAYVDRFNARDFDTIRDLLAEDVQLDLVNRTRMNGRTEVGTYLGNYSRVHDWRLVAGFVDGRPAILVHDPAGSTMTPTYFVLLGWSAGRISRIRDFRHARYAIEGAELIIAH